MRIVIKNNHCTRYRKNTLPSSPALVLVVVRRSFLWLSLSGRGNKPVNWISDSVAWFVVAVVVVIVASSRFRTTPIVGGLGSESGVEELMMIVIVMMMMINVFWESLILSLVYILYGWRMHKLVYLKLQEQYDRVMHQLTPMQTHGHTLDTPLQVLYGSINHHFQISKSMGPINKEEKWISSEGTITSAM